VSVTADGADIEVEEAIFGTLQEQGRPLPLRDSDAATIAVTLAMAEEALDGTITPRELAAWAHRYVTHQGPPALQNIVDMDDRYDQVGVADSEAELDAETLAEAHQLVSSLRA
jgi:hypothetical protein